MQQQWHGSHDHRFDHGCHQRRIDHQRNHGHDRWNIDGWDDDHRNGRRMQLAIVWNVGGLLSHRKDHPLP